MAKWLEKLKAAVDPVGPLGAVVSPSDVFKERLGLPVTSPHVQRVEMVAPGHIEHTLAPARFIPADEAVDVPSERVRQVSAFIEEVWTPEYRKTDSTDIFVILAASQDLIGWTVTQRQSQTSRAKRHLSDQEFVEIAQSCQIQASDAFYDGYYETIAGNDPVILDGEILRGEATYETNPDGSQGKMIHDGIVRGGTQIRGRQQYDKATKNYVHYDKGGWEKHLAAEAEYASRPVRNVRRALEDCQNALPLWRPVGINFRRDRRSAV